MPNVDLTSRLPPKQASVESTVMFTEGVVGNVEAFTTRPVVNVSDAGKSDASTQTGSEKSKENKSSKLDMKEEIVLTKEIKDALGSTQVIQYQCDELVGAANASLNCTSPMILCCTALEEAFSVTYPNCKVYPFGSRVSGLGNIASDLDIFVDCGDMYLGTKAQDAHSQKQFVSAACKIFSNRKNEFTVLNSVPTARTPIVRIFHKASNIDCDLSFRHGLSVENTKFLRFCIEIQPVTQQLILFLKKWIYLCSLKEKISTYALSMLVIYFMQVKNYLLPVQSFKMLNPAKIIVIDGCLSIFGLSRS